MSSRLTIKKIVLLSKNLFVVSFVGFFIKDLFYVLQRVSYLTLQIKSDQMQQDDQYRYFITKSEHLWKHSSK